MQQSPVERLIFPDKTFRIRNQADELFIGLFGSNESITLFDYDVLTSRIAQYFNWTADEAKATLAFLTFDLSASSFSSNWLFSPFLKINNQIIWLGAFLKDRRWDTILFNKLKREGKYNALGNELSKNFELSIERLFKSNSYKTRCGLPFTSSNGQSGDFDVLAFKDNYLFVCEAKTGDRSDGFRHAALSETVKLEGLAAEQLEKALFNIQKDWANIKTKLGVDEAVVFETLIIVPLIVTDFFEGDLRLYKNKVRKISLLELEVIFENKKKELLNLYFERFVPLSDSQNPNFNKDREAISNWDLWEGRKELEVATLLRNIEQNAIWKELETIWKFEDEEYGLEY